MHVLYSLFCLKSKVTSMPWFEAGVSTGSPPKVAPGDVVELQVHDDTGATQGTILVGVWRQAGSYKNGIVIEGRFLGASGLYYQWWMKGGQGAPSMHKGWYYLCGVPSASSYDEIQGRGAQPPLPEVPSSPLHKG